MSEPAAERPSDESELRAALAAAEELARAAPPADITEELRGQRAELADLRRRLDSASPESEVQKHLSGVRAEVREMLAQMARALETQTVELVKEVSVRLQEHAARAAADQQQQSRRMAAAEELLSAQHNALVGLERRVDEETRRWLQHDNATVLRRVEALERERDDGRAERARHAAFLAQCNASVADLYGVLELSKEAAARAAAGPAHDRAQLLLQLPAFRELREVVCPLQVPAPPLRRPSPVPDGVWESKHNSPRRRRLTPSAVARGPPQASPRSSPPRPPHSRTESIAPARPRAAAARTSPDRSRPVAVPAAGLQVVDGKDSLGGATVVTVAAGGPAEAAGWSVGDHVTQINDEAVAGAAAMASALSLKDRWEPVTITRIPTGCYRPVTSGLVLSGTPLRLSSSDTTLSVSPCRVASGSRW
eukprot:TRINITY_DN16776_c0_g1_i2.p1 TRINITY_DN16776_c0_g1~~TRINITY_DN16776_c0_g1_i2.p1  ORF type:complete len:455 (+),score=156.46 TRINITY_DN16776_c0_g1_i2:97-1365(+)